ncbi:diguanylate cyclase [Anabaena cylindrica FACHB-243]|uniref:Response regulator receiver modulated diguanylate cyclase n=1 Tax=Anabaena cylindrica (strain ATCC 27899 / PCC 7122) TaxID=272123 RepID=K9ZKG5_ANACC|nr:MULTISPECIES: diguanylate cyclase [Anabaena]AFZ59259.1 response regulator receiver modulated diguanylate cyclase [Anabaena cylindrica PCC 7122]MBD2416883.1 diguanylate cyclase [Anabaena cylindrica FACHB-243]MBY5284393.1 diguanylate cyclase [Anabaena sp. CCAP 1446/1C]MBY5310817.1 diguanylate cyclase [Anabaena sp. CCAP 1446/1C]MCM2410252.1 diguanylate cyclase [Anabaena sp. CCAP 1446/1C]
MNLDSQSENKGNILLVDDIPENLQLLSDLLVKLGYTVRSVTSGRMALKTVKIKQPDVILLDIKMPEMDGYQVCQFLKADENLRHIPVIFISALDDVFDKVIAFNSGGIDYITKPFQIEEVVARLENQLIIQRQQRLLQKEVNNRREAEEVLHHSRALLASILNSSLDGIAAMQAVRNPATGDIEDFRCLVVNPVIARVFERSREDLIGKLVLRKFLNNIEPELFDQFVEIVETAGPLERDFYYPSGESSWFHFVAVKLGDGFAITIRDITTRKEIELALQQANQRLEILANLDALTQVANRRCFNERLLHEWEELARCKQPLSLIIFDIDYFKYYNDYYGHLVGDDCLFQIAQSVYQLICHLDISRPSDLVARYGGEEFTILLPKTDLEEGIKVAARIQQIIHDLAIPHVKSEIRDIVTVSLGVASLIPSMEVKPDTLIALADKALYNSKQQGRDRYSSNS